jgi:hypothetical protein
VTLAVTGNTFSGQVARRQRVHAYQVSSIAVDRKSMGHTVGERWWKDADFLCLSCISAWRLWKSVVTLAVTRNTISVWVIQRHRVNRFISIIDCR